MVASRELELPYYRGVTRQRGRGFGALAQVIGRTAVPFVTKFIVPAARRVGADLLEYAVSEMAEVISGKKFKIGCNKCWPKDVEKTTRWR